MSTFLHRFFTIAYFALFLSPHASATTFHDAVMPEKVLDYLVYSNHNAPYQFSDVENGHKGIVCHIVDRIAARSGSVVHPHMEPIKRLKRSIELNKYRHWITYGVRSWQTLPAWRDHHFSRIDIFQFNPVLIQLADADVVINTLADIGSKKVLIIRGLDYGATYDFMVSRGATIESVDTQKKALNMLRQGRADVFLEDKHRVDYALATTVLRPDFFRMAPVTGASLEALSVALVMSKDMPAENVAVMNQVLQEMSESGELEALVNRYNKPLSVVQSDGN